MKAADDRNPSIPECPGQVVGPQDGISRTFDGTEEPEPLSFQDFWIPDDGYPGKLSLNLVGAEWRRIEGAA